MKRFNVIAFLLLITLMVVGCHDGLESESKEVNKEKITFRITWKTYSGRGEAIQAIINEYNVTNNQYEIVLLDGDEDLGNIRADIDNQRVDLFVLPYRYVKLLGYENQLMPLDTSDYVAEGVINKALLSYGRIKKAQYGIPWVSHSMALIYNKDILDNCDVDVETIVDRESFEIALKSIDGNAAYSGIGLVGADHNDLSWMVNQCVHGNGGCLIKDKTVMINSEDTAQGIAYYRDVLGAYAQESWLDDTGSEVMQAFREEKVAFEIQSLWGITDIWKNGNPFEVGTIPLDRIGLKSEVGPMMLAYGANLSEEKRLVVDDFIKYMLSIEVQEAIMKGEFNPERAEFYPFRLPVRQDVFELESFSKYEDFKVFTDAYEYSSIDVPNPYWMQIKESIYTPNLHKVMRKEMTIDEFLELVEYQGRIIIGEEN